jgi:peptidoglycan/xylan/chitin deacetylase (PgdA/CDA1 family)
MRGLRPFLRCLPGNRLLVVAFHRVAREFDPYDPETPDAVRFSQQLDALGGFEVVSLGVGLAALQEGRLKRTAVAITFDDGYREQLSVAAPLLEQRGYPSTVFVSSAFVGGQNMWHDRLLWALREGRAGSRLDAVGLSDAVPSSLAARRQLAGRCIAAVKSLPLVAREQAVGLVEAACGAPSAPRLMLDATELRELAARPGVEIGAHTRRHPILAACALEEARAEVSGSRADLEKLLGMPVGLFAYPNGHEGRDFGERDVGLVREAGFSHAFTSDWGVVAPASDSMKLPRVSLYRQSAFGNALLLAREALR